MKEEIIECGCFYATGSISDGICSVHHDKIIKEAKEEELEIFEKCIELHRSLSVITCDENCFCWEADNIIEKRKYDL